MVYPLLPIPQAFPDSAERRSRQALPCIGRVHQIEYPSYLRRRWKRRLRQIAAAAAAAVPHLIASAAAQQLIQP